MTQQDTFTEKISLWLDDQLSPPEVTELQQHMASCTACRQTYQQMQYMDRWLRQAAAVMAAPAPGFVQRFEVTLAQHRPQKWWQVWLALGGLLAGALFFLAGWGIAGGLTLVNTGISLLDVQVVFQGVIAIIDSADTLGFFTNLGLLMVRTSVATMQQPLFWGGVLLAALLAWLWFKTMQLLIRRNVVMAELML